jgi:hypothetical protein
MSDFKTILVKDSVIGDITSDLDFAVKSGASQTTFQPFPSTSASNSALIWNVQVPSENVVIGRDILLNTALVIELSYAGVQQGDSVWSYGLTDSFQAFPMNSLFTTATAQINNTTVSINSKDVLPSLLRMNDSRELYRYNSMTPALPDQAYGYYGNAVNANNNPLASYNNASYDLDQVPRGAFPIIYQVAHFDNTGYIDDSPIALGSAGEYWKIGVATIVTEPIFLSPFIWANPEYNCQGLLGINNMAFTMNIDSTATRVWSTASPYFTGIVLGSPTAQCFNQTSAFTLPPTPAGQTSLISNTNGVPSLLFKFLSTQPSDLIQTKNVVPYMDFPRYLTSSANNPTFTTVGQSGIRVNSSNLQINQIPDYFIITARIPMSQQTPQLSMSQFVIQNISINLNNQSGLLSSASQYDLWRTSAKNGSAQSWAEFSGLQSSFTNGVSQNIATTGSVLVLSPPYDLSLPNYISSGSLGNYNFQFSVTVASQYPQEIYDLFENPNVPGTYAIPIELCVVCVNSGIFSTQQGVSAVYTGILTKEMVLSSVNGQQASAMTSQETSRMIGGQMLNGALTAIRGMRKHLKSHSMPAHSGGAMGTASSGGRSGMSKYC